MGDNGRVLIVDDEPNALRVLSAVLSQDGYEVLQSGDVDGAVSIIGREDVDAVITDLRMPGKDGLQLFEYISDGYPDIPVIFLTAYGTVETAVHAIKQGAYYYLVKPPDYMKLRQNLASAVENRRLKRELKDLREGGPEENGLCIMGRTPEMLEVFRTIRAIRNSDSSVLVCGETGTGKELAAKALHYSGGRKEKSFVAVNCAAIPRELLESELFGFQRGAFTGAVSSRPGKFEEAAGGTLFLDEIGELDLSLQAKLLRVLEEKAIERLGSNRKIPADFRLVSSTNRDLEEDVSMGKFREDLYYRINVIKITTVPLRKRMDDIPILVSEFLREFCLREDKALGLSDEVLRIFQGFRWPGNIRQLRNVMERAVVLANGNTITAKELPGEFFSRRAGSAGSKIITKTLRELENEAVKEALLKCEGNKSKAARLLGISRKAFYKRLGELASR
jgi:DNA-binding NtrC family response regulator